MRKLSVFLVLLFGAITCFSTTGISGIKPHDVAGKPTTYCKVVKEPDPLLMGGWKCRVTGVNDRGKQFDNPVEYWLVKQGDQYALYYYYSSPADNKIGWEAFTVNDKELVSSDGKREFFTKGDGKVYFKGPSGSTFEMKRIEDK